MPSVSSAGNVIICNGTGGGNISGASGLMNAAPNSIASTSAQCVSRDPIKHFFCNRSIAYRFFSGRGSVRSETRVILFFSQRFKMAATNP